MTRQTLSTDPADRQLKERHRAMWALGDYPAVARVAIPTLGRTLVDATGVGPGDRVLDVAAGSGNASVPAARTGADVVATDLTPELLDHGRDRAEAEGLELAWQVADVEELPFADAEFDVALSCVGVMFAPHHRASADEITRVVRPGGRIGLASWTPEGFIGQMFATMKPYAPPPPPGAQPPPLWGDADHVAALFGDQVHEVSATRRQLVVDAFDSPHAFRDFFKATYGPTIAVYRAIADEPDRVRALDDALAALAADHDRGGGVMEWEYLLWTATRSGG